MAKKCVYTHCKNGQFGGGYCRWHQWCRDDVVKYVKPITEEQSEDLKIYKVLSTDYLYDHPVCECGREGCERPAEEVHHARGRGKWLNVVKYFKALAAVCHKWVHAHPKEAEALGLIVLKHKIYEDEKTNCIADDHDTYVGIIPEFWPGVKH